MFCGLNEGRQHGCLLVLCIAPLLSGSEDVTHEGTTRWNIASTIVHRVLTDIFKPRSQLRLDSSLIMALNVLPPLALLMYGECRFTVSRDFPDPGGAHVCAVRHLKLFRDIVELLRAYEYKELFQPFFHALLISLSVESITQSEEHTAGAVRREAVCSHLSWFPASPLHGSDSSTHPTGDPRSPRLWRKCDTYDSYVSAGRRSTIGDQGVFVVLLSVSNVAHLYLLLC